MEYIIPYYYKDFHCAADQCTDTCCAGWEIMIDKKTLKKYRRYPGDFGNRLHNSINWETHSFLQYEEKRCAFLNEDNLCDICLEAGEDMLCRTCRRYPRHYEEFENVREISLSLSCPQAAKLILGTDRPVYFLSTEQETDTEEYEYFDFFLYTKLLEVREHFFDIIKNQEYSLETKMALMLAQSHDIQNRINRHELFDVDRLLERYRKPQFVQQAQKKWKKYGHRGEVRYYLMHGMMYRLHQLEVLDPLWDKELRRCEHTLYESMPPKDYMDLKDAFENAVKDRVYEYDRLLEYFLFVYFCGAVYDGNPFTKIKSAVVHTMLIRELDMACWIQKHSFTFQDQIRIAHKYAREVEHSDINLNRIEKMMKEDPFFDLDHLLVCILGQQMF